MKTKALLWSLVFLSMEMAQCQTKEYSEKLASLYEYTVPLINSKDLNKELEKAVMPVLLDIRSAEEYDVSRIEGAKFIEFDKFSESDVADIPKDAEIIVYCSVGYRSEKIGEKLIGMGYANVKNLYGGIFQWKNEGNPVVNNHSIETDSVHAYDRYWGIWLEKGVKVY